MSIETTVIEKSIAYPTDARLYEKARSKIVALAQEAGIQLRQTYTRKAPLLAAQVGRYAQARQFKRMRKAFRRLKGNTGGVMCDLRRQMDLIPPCTTLRETVLDALVLVSRLLHHAPRGGGRIYALHEPDVDCISKGKARIYEFGTKVSIATTINEGFVVGMRVLPGTPYDGHTLADALEQVEILTDQRPERAVVDRGYRGHGVETTQVLISGSKRGLAPALKKLLRRCSAIEAEIGRMKTDGRLAKCPLKGLRGDAIFAVLCGCGHNLRKKLNHIRKLSTVLLAVIATVLAASVIIRTENRRSV